MENKPTYEKLVVSTAPHLIGHTDTRRTMGLVMLALVPSLLVSTYVFGFRVIILSAVCIGSAMLFEYLFNKLLKRPQTVGDLSAALTGLLLAFNVPSNFPFWMAIIGTFVAIIIVKQLYGGIGQNLVNPAITARIVLFISFATEMTTWPVPKPLLIDSETGATPFAVLKTMFTVDSQTGATPLSILAEGGGELPDNVSTMIGTIGGSAGEVSGIALIIGGIFLIWKKIITPIIPLTFIGTVAVFALIIGQDPIFHIFAGGVLLGAIFMATDYVTSPTIKIGQVIFGIGCGLLTMLIRCYGSYPEGVSFAILIMNIVTPHIDTFAMYLKFKKGVKQDV